MGNDRGDDRRTQRGDEDEEARQLVAYLTAPDGMEILRGGLSLAASGAAILGGCVLWWPGNEVARVGAQLAGGLTILGIISAIRGAYLLYRNGINAVPPKLGWMTHNLAPEDPRARILAERLSKDAQDRAARRAKPFWRRALDVVLWVKRAVGVILKILFALIFLALVSAAAVWASYWVFDRATTDYALLAGILISCPFWLLIWSVAITIWRVILLD